MLVDALVLVHSLMEESVVALVKRHANVVDRMNK